MNNENTMFYNPRLENLQNFVDVRLNGQSTNNSGKSRKFAI